MKNLMRSFAILTMLLFALNANAQTASATVSATIIQPITISKTVDMNFGNAIVDATTGTIVLTPAGTRSTTGGVSFLTATPGTVTAASFEVTGGVNATYAITLPAAAITNKGGDNMTVDNWTTDATGLLNGIGKEIFNVGATLHVSANQVSGTYLSTIPFTVTVNYN
jgi:hypothetical protein